MHSLPSAAATVDSDAQPFRIDPLDNLDIDHIDLSPCGTRIESFDCDGAHFVIDWDELVGDPDEEEIPHEQVMAQLDQHIETLLARRGAAR